MKNHFKLEHKKVGWLGTGIYFFEDNKSMAENFALRMFGKEIGVLKCEIDVPDAQVFDVTNPLGESNKRFHAYRKELIKEAVNKKLNITARDKQEFDGKVFNMLCIRYKYKLVRNYTYTYQEEDKRDSMFSRVANGIELCVREKDFITQKEIV